MQTFGTDKKKMNFWIFVLPFFPKKINKTKIIKSKVKGRDRNDDFH